MDSALFQYRTNVKKRMPKTPMSRDKKSGMNNMAKSRPEPRYLAWRIAPSARGVAKPRPHFTPAFNSATMPFEAGMPPDTNHKSGARRPDDGNA
jgi:hypothetical protein